MFPHVFSKAESFYLSFTQQLNLTASFPLYLKNNYKLDFCIVKILPKYDGKFHFFYLNFCCRRHRHVSVHQNRHPLSLFPYSPLAETALLHREFNEAIRMILILVNKSARRRNPQNLSDAPLFGSDETEIQPIQLHGDVGCLLHHSPPWLHDTDWRCMYSSAGLVVEILQIIAYFAGRLFSVGRLQSGPSSLALPPSVVLKDLELQKACFFAISWAIMTFDYDKDYSLIVSPHARQ